MRKKNAEMKTRLMDVRSKLTERLKYIEENALKPSGETLEDFDLSYKKRRVESSEGRRVKRTGIPGSPEFQDLGNPASDDLLGAAEELLKSHEL